MEDRADSDNDSDGSDESGGGSQPSPTFPSKVSSSEVTEEMLRVQASIEKAESDITKVEDALDTLEASIRRVEDKKEKVQLIKDRAYLRNEKAQLRTKEAQLRTKEAQLRTEKVQLRTEEDRLKAQIMSGAPQIYAQRKSIADSFYDALKSGNLDFSPEGQVLRFGNEAWNTSAYPSELYVRQCWGDLYDVMQERLSLGFRRIVVTGVPGIGKSQFMLYFMWRLVQKNEGSFLVEKSKRKVRRYSSGKMDRYENYPLDLPSGVPYLCDISEKALPYMDYIDWEPSYTVVFSSPNPERFKELVKLNQSVILVMPPWDAEEIVAAQTLLTCYKGLSLDVVKSQFTVYGGVPRYVLEKASEGVAPMEDAFSRKGAGTARRHFRGEETTVDSDVSHMLTRIDPADDCTFVGRNYSAASVYVLERLFALHQSIMLDELRNIVSMKQDSGGIFEYLAARYGLANAKHDLHGLPLPSGLQNSNPLPPPPPPPRSLSFGAYERLPVEWRNGNWTPHPGILYYQNVNNMKSVDAFIIGNQQELILLQMTVGATHSVKASGLEEIYKLFSSRFPPLVTAASLVFVTPAKSSLATVQPLINSKNQLCKIESDIALPVRHMMREQFVIRINVHELRV